jgi:hypothetical protein
MNCLPKHVNEGKIEGTGGRGRRRKHLLDDLKEMKGYWKWEEEVLDLLCVFNQLDALFSLFSSIYFSTSNCFKRQVLIIRREQLYQYILWYNTLEIK